MIKIISFVLACLSSRCRAGMHGVGDAVSLHRTDVGFVVGENERGTYAVARAWIPRLDSLTLWPGGLRRGRAARR